MEIKELADLIVQKIKEEHHTFWIDPEIHSTQHEFIKILIKEREEKAARAERIKEKVAGSIILSSVLVLISFIGIGALDWIKTHIK